MCGVVAKSGPRAFRRVSRSVRIDGHATSIQLETAFWDVLDAMAEREGVTVPKLLAALHEESAELRGGMTNFASMLRTICLLYQGAAPE
ncbi:ribbon-helix-helix domain-containing protein [Amaricoccus sp.]|uniref:ribbon-helix-helix domain-containing protein n=1 Tax=Amaricoccus sp. TaxID=1872485 RepID=UPI00261F5C65|nr:ribbon-helix-helix domain-containing protein [uncultured Amaricoccus sp.]